MPSLACCYTDEGTPFCRGRRFETLPMCKKHMHEAFKAAIFDALLPWDVVRELISYTDQMSRVRSMAARYEMDAVLSSHRREKERANAERKQFSLVYYVRLSGGRIKIGRTTNVPQRMESLRARNDDLLAIEPGDHTVETARHRQFAETRHGRLEDFDATPELLAHIQAVRDEWPTLQDGWLAA